MTVRVTVTLPDEVLELLDDIAQKEGVSRSDVVREASSRYVAERSEREALDRRRTVVEEGIAWLGEASTRNRGGPSSLEVLRDLRSAPTDSLGRTLEPEIDDPGMP